MFNTSRFLSLLRAKTIGRHIEYVKETTSTQDWSAEYYASASADTRASGSIFLAEAQTKGRGRKGRSFTSSIGGNLYFTMVFQDVQESYLFSPIHLVRAVPCALVQACASVGVEAQIKWPNDVWISGRLKAAGVLIDTQSLPNRMLRCCVGVGINVNADPALHDPTLALIATCLRKHSKTPGNDVDREAFLASFCDHLEQYLMSSSGAENLERDYRQASLVIGRHVTVYPADTSSSTSSTPSPENSDSSRNSYEAVAMDVDSFGFLKVRRIDDGSEVTLSAEEVSIRPT